LHKQLFANIGLFLKWQSLQNFFLYTANLYRSFTQIYFMGIWRQIAEYLYIKKPDPNKPYTKWVKYMHGMNRISLFMFIIALLVMLFRLVILPMIRKH